jgi:hypothetical protein
VPGAQLDARSLRRVTVVGDQAPAAVERADVKPAPEHVPALDRVGLPVVHQAQPDPELTQPSEGLPGIGDEQVGEVWVGASFGDAVHVVTKLGCAVGIEIGGLHGGGIDRLHQREHVRQAVVHAADRPRGEVRVAAQPVRWRLLEQHYARTPLGRGVGRTESGISCPDDDHIGVATHVSPSLSYPEAYPDRCNR